MINHRLSMGNNKIDSYRHWLFSLQCPQTIQVIKQLKPLLLSYVPFPSYLLQTLLVHHDVNVFLHFLISFLLTTAILQCLNICRVRVLNSPGTQISLKHLWRHKKGGFLC
ncbi:hypothetical protein XELAEV_18017261mg [Xenopus laevis]|uniref:Uncharacterized protein n=1 Tax=Xenopus laevis TaxID=8355 RepID=A0A974DCS6_XENLA|nr:hypothetical protein XELAEV_18017261mg [Xenopus laevis]